MRILITGASGFVGSALGPRLIAAGHDLICVCRPGSTIAFGGSIRWAGDATKFPDDVDVVIHLAQSRNYRNFPADSRDMFDINVGMTMSLLNFAARSNVKQFVLASSGAVYEPFTVPLLESAALAPTGFLGASKYASEVIAQPFSSLFKLNILRLFFPYGPRQQDRLIPDLIKRVGNGQAVQVTSNGDGMRLVPTFVENVADVFLTALQASWTGTVNVSTPEVLSIGEIVEIIGRRLGVQPKLEIVDRTPINVVPDLKCLSERFDLGGFTRFEEGLRKTIEGNKIGHPLS
jgi:nucleoside-diphosphate-sugar epimerase